MNHKNGMSQKKIEREIIINFIILSSNDTPTKKTIEFDFWEFESF